MFAMEDKRIFEIVSSLINIRSVSGEESEIVDYLKTLFSSMGFCYEIMPSGSICAIVDRGISGPVVVMDGHIDTVDVPNPSLWKRNPFNASVDNGKLYGRGASDMKGAVGAMIAALESFSKKSFKGKVVMACIVEEERFEGIASREVSEHFTPDYVIIGEASNRKLNLGQRGRCEVQLLSKGISCHSSNPGEGRNAVLNMMDAINQVEALPVVHDEFLGDGIFALTDIKSNPYPGSSVIPEECLVTYDRRILTGETPSSVLAPIEKALAGSNVYAKIAYGETISYKGKHLEAQRFFPAWRISKDSDLAVKASKGLEKHSLFEGFGYYGFCTNGSHYAGEKNIATIGYGPGEERLAHIVDEYVPLPDLSICANGYEAILESLLS